MTTLENQDTARPLNSVEPSDQPEQPVAKKNLAFLQRLKAL